jgi:hypothetical protein
MEKPCARFARQQQLRLRLLPLPRKELKISFSFYFVTFWEIIFISDVRKPVESLSENQNVSDQPAL